MPRRLLTIVVAAALLVVPEVAAAQKLVFVTRHAERADEPAHDQPDPPLSPEGKARALKLETMLQDAHIEAIYVTQYRRTQQTAAPLADKLDVTPEVMPTSLPALLDALKAHHADDVVLIVAHSSTIPAIIKALAGPSVDLDESDYSSLFVVVPVNHTVLRMHY